jgi:hypothetical protein
VFLCAKARARGFGVVVSRTIDDLVARAEREVDGAPIDQTLGERRDLALVLGPDLCGIGDATSKDGMLAFDVARLGVPLLGVDKGWRWCMCSRGRRSGVSARAKGHLGLTAAVRVGRIEFSLHRRKQESIQSTMLAAVLASLRNETR